MGACRYPVVGTSHKAQSGFTSLGTLDGTCSGAPFSIFARILEGARHLGQWPPDGLRSRPCLACATPPRSPEQASFRYPFSGTVNGVRKSRAKNRHENRCQKRASETHLLNRLIACQLRMVAAVRKERLPRERQTMKLPPQCPTLVNLTFPDI